MWGWLVRIGIVAVIAGGAFLFRDRLSGNAGCNDYHGSYRFEGGSFRLLPIEATLGSCADHVMAHETRYLGTLESTRRWSVDGATLTYTIFGIKKKTA